MRKEDLAVSVFKTHQDAESAIKSLERAGFDLKKLSIVGKDYHTEEHVVGYYNSGDRIGNWGRNGAFWGAVWGWLFGAAFFFIPGLGPILVAGPLVAGIVGALVLAVVAWRLDLPGLVLVILTVFTGASVTTFGTMVVLGRVSPAALGQAQITAVFGDGWGWYALYVGLVVLGLVAQWRYLKVRNPVRTKWNRAS